MPASTPVDEHAQLESFVAAFDDFVRAAKRARSRLNSDETLTPAQFDLLAPLGDAGDALGLRELARAAGMSAPTATRMIDGLQARGLVLREPCPRDRRAVRISLTADGSEAVAAYRERMLARRRAVFEQLAPEERRAVARVLQRLAAAYEEIGG